jgi:hypothetical protein
MLGPMICALTASEFEGDFSDHLRRLIHEPVVLRRIGQAGCDESLIG